MEEKHQNTIKIVLLSIDYDLPVQTLRNFTPILTKYQLKQINPPSFLDDRFELDIKVLHICLYYIIAITKNLTNHQLKQYQEKCIGQIEDYYVGRNMKFQHYQYGYFCSKILKENLDRCLHVLYFMVFGRFASRSYIGSLIKPQKELSKLINARKTCQTIKSNHNKNTLSRKNTLFGTTLSVNQFNQQLQQTLYPNKTSSKFFKKPKKIIKQVHLDNTNKSKSNIHTETDQIKVLNPLKKNQIVASKVGFFENSSVINYAKMKMKYETKIEGLERCEKQIKRKMCNRKAKFNQNYNGNSQISKLYAFIAKDKENKRLETQNYQMEQNLDTKSSFTGFYKNSKKTMDFFKRLAKNVKETNINLEKIRQQSKPQYKFHEKQNPKKKAVDIDNEKLIIKHPNSNNNVNIPDIQPTISFRSQSYKSTKMITSQKSEQNTEYYKPHVRITRKNDINSHDEEPNLLMFAKETSKILGMNYKNEYKLFVKGQMFQRSKISPL